MRIAIVDDDEKFLAQAFETLVLVLSERGTPAEVEKFVSAEALLSRCGGGTSFDMYLLDVVMPGTDGIALGRTIRQGQPKAPILFFTTSRDYAVEAFGIAATDYVIKPFSTEDFARAIDRAFERLASATEPKLALRLSDGIVRVALSDVVSVETGGHYLTVSLVAGRSHVVRQTLQELWEAMKNDTRFCRIGRQAIVNFARVTDFTGDALCLVGERRLSIPRRLRTEVKAAYLDFYSA